RSSAAPTLPARPALSLHDALPILAPGGGAPCTKAQSAPAEQRSNDWPRGAEPPAPKHSQPLRSSGATTGPGGRSPLHQSTVSPCGAAEQRLAPGGGAPCTKAQSAPRSEEHTSELQSQSNLVCRLLLE